MRRDDEARAPSVRWSRTSWRRTRSAVASVTAKAHAASARVRKALSRSWRRFGCEGRAGGAEATSLPSRMRTSSSSPLRLVHDVASRRGGSCPTRRGRERASRGRAGAPGRARPSARRGRAARARRAGRSPATTRERSPPESVPHDLVGLRPEVDRSRWPTSMPLAAERRGRARSSGGSRGPSGRRRRTAPG